MEISATKYRSVLLLWSVSNKYFSSGIALKEEDLLSALMILFICERYITVQITRKIFCPEQDAGSLNWKCAMNMTDSGIRLFDILLLFSVVEYIITERPTMIIYYESR